MQFIKAGKTKDVYKLEDGNILLKFKDTITGGEDGQSDPGGNLVVGEAAGVGSSALKMTSFYFDILKKEGVETHYISSDLAKCEMKVRPATTFGKGLEFVIRYEAFGSFVKRFGDFCKEGDDLGGLVEVTLKDDAKNDPPVTKEILTALKIISDEQYEQAVAIAKRTCEIVRRELKNRGIKLVDIKVECGLVDGKVALIDEISGGNMRSYKDGKKLSYQELSALSIK